MDKDLLRLLAIPTDRLEAINSVLLDPDEKVMNDFLAVVAKYGTPEEINRKHRESRKLDHLLKIVTERAPEYVNDLKWLTEQRDNKAFTSISEYRTRVLGEKAREMKFADELAVTLEVSALQYFPWIRPMCERAIKDRSLVPGRFIAVRKMKESELDGDLPAIVAALGYHGFVIRRNPRHERHRRIQSSFGWACNDYRIFWWNRPAQ